MEALFSGIGEEGEGEQSGEDMGRMILQMALNQLDEGNTGLAKLVLQQSLAMMGG